MAIQTQLYSENLGFPFVAGDDGGGGGGGGGGGINYSSQDWMENACGLNDFYLFNLQQQQQQQQQVLKNQDFYSENGFSFNANINNNNNNKNLPMNSRSLSTYIQKQNQELEGFISLQNERLRLALQTHRKQQLLTILKKYELKSEVLLKQKDEEIKRAITRRMELEELLRRTDMERQTWQIAAKEKEAMVMNLNNTILQVREKWMKQQDDEDNLQMVEDEGSCCHGNDDDDDDISNNNNNNNKKKMICKSCFKEDSCVVMLPCRHLCSCRSCDAFLNSCPVCKMVKKATIQLEMDLDSNL